MKTTTDSYGALPTFFRGACMQAAQGGGGPVSNYESAGYSLGRHLADLGPYDLDHAEWAERLTAFEKCSTSAERIAWLKVHVPRCIALVPAKRHRSFVAGVERAIDEHGLG